MDDKHPKLDARSENSLQHGLTAKKLLPGALRPGRLDELKAAFREEYRPTTVTGELLVAEAARHAAMLELIELAEPAVMHQAIEAIASLPRNNDRSDDMELELAAAVSAEPLDRVTRYRRGHERAFHQTVDKLSASRPKVSSAVNVDPCESGFETETACNEFLRKRFSVPDWRCPRCHHSRGHILITRDVWECSHCHHQVSSRHGTVMQNSRLPLPLWFAAIRVFAAKTNITSAELALTLGIRRQATARKMLCRMNAALTADDVCARFAGLGSDRPSAD